MSSSPRPPLSCSGGDWGTIAAEHYQAQLISTALGCDFVDRR